MSWLRYFPLIILPVALCGQQLTYATYQGGSGTENTSAVALDSAGNVYLAGSTDSVDFSATTIISGLGGASSTGGGFIVKLDSTGHRVAALLIRGTAINALAIDGAGNVVIAGTMTVGALAPTAGAYFTPKGTGFVARVAPSLAQIQWASTFLASPAALAVDATGIYTTGSATTGFVTTAGVVQAANRGSTDAFVLKLSPDGTTALYATFLGGSNEDMASAIAVDSVGQVYLTGATGSADFPLTSSPAQSGFGGRLAYFPNWYGDAFVAKLDPKGATLLYSTYLGGVAADEGNAITVDGSGNAYVAGGTESATFLAGAAKDVYQATYAGPVPDPDFPFTSGDAFVAKLNSQGQLSWYTYLGGRTYDAATAIALDKNGNILIVGNSDSVDFPKVGNPVHDCHIGGRPFLAELDPNGARLLMTSGLSGIGYDQAYAMAFDVAHSVVYVAGDAASQVFFSTPTAAQTAFGGGDSDAFVARVDLTLQPSMVVACVLNAVSYVAGNTAAFPTGAVAPGEIVSLFGVGLGPDPAAGLQLTSTGTVATSLGGTQVLFDGVAAPLLYVANGQINAVVPYGVKLPVTKMTVQRGAFSAGPVVMPVTPAVPAIFTYDGSGTGSALAFNQDFTYNTPANPAVRGQFIIFYAVGAGLMSSNVDGAVTPLTLPPDQLPVPQQPVTVTIRGVNATVLYAGAAPGYVSGLLQLNVLVPTTVDFGDHLPLFLNIGKFSSQFNISIAAK